MDKKSKSHIVAGSIIALILIVLNIIVICSHQLGNATMGMVPYAILIASLIISCVLFGRKMNGEVTFGNVFAYGFRIVAVVIVFYFIWTILSMKVFFPDQLEIMLRDNKIEMEKMGLPKDEIEKRLAFGKNNAVVVRNGANILVIAILGAIGSLLGAVFANKNAELEQPFKKA